MPHKPSKLLLSFWARSLGLAIVALFTCAVDSNAQETLRPHAPPILHSFLDSATVVPGERDGGSVERVFLCGLRERGHDLQRQGRRPNRAT